MNRRLDSLDKQGELLELIFSFLSKFVLSVEMFIRKLHTYFFIRRQWRQQTNALNCKMVFIFCLCLVLMMMCGVCYLNIQKETCIEIGLAGSKIIVWSTKMTRETRLLACCISLIAVQTSNKCPMFTVEKVIMSERVIWREKGGGGEVEKKILCVREMRLSSSESAKKK